MVSGDRLRVFRRLAVTEDLGSEFEFARVGAYPTFPERANEAPLRAEMPRTGRGIGAGVMPAAMPGADQARSAAYFDVLTVRAPPTHRDGRRQRCAAIAIRVLPLGMHAPDKESVTWTSAEVPVRQRSELFNETWDEFR